MKDYYTIRCIASAILVFMTFTVYGQSENFDKGKAAFLDGKHREALTFLNQAVHNDKFLMKGKDIPVAYAYLAIIRNEHLSKKLELGNVSMIQQSPGLLNSTISDVTNALKYQDNSSKSLVNKAYNQMIENAMHIGKIVTDSLLYLDLETQVEEAKSLALILNYELKDLSDIDKDNWELHDMIGLSYYILDEPDLAMLEFKRGRDIYNDQAETKVSDLHLYNCVYSTKYNYKVSKNYQEAYNASVDGHKIIMVLMDQVNPDSLSHLKNLAAIDGTFSSIQSRVENMNIISSNKE
ncbi:hypothetical protein N6H18_14340 [Reichenbachiella agarivorans]|uniref:Tetratricopeptide repeat-containing protein n=1 Tax=Reichenbachiella agarivorans TaxID=2979464 RepID=A0ABY6CM29_9BACT|nr:hypothetical protein [Reichenbachiella agarivorans]UXP31527.1 hypothetical protein N6H18_14340 [Reichenbachiella agarivorans]